MFVYIALNTPFFGKVRSWSMLKIYVCADLWLQSFRTRRSEAQLTAFRWARESLGPEMPRSWGAWNGRLCYQWRRLFFLLQTEYFRINFLDQRNNVSTDWDGNEKTKKIQLFLFVAKENHKVRNARFFWENRNAKFFWGDYKQLIYNYPRNDSVGRSLWQASFMVVAKIFHSHGPRQDYLHGKVSDERLLTDPAECCPFRTFSLIVPIDPSSISTRRKRCWIMLGCPADGYRRFANHRCL